jgi:CDP-glycerol glycerophosphotransferase
MQEGISYLLSPSKFCTERFISAFNLKYLQKEKIIIEKGYPRNDFLFAYTQSDIENIKSTLGISKDKKVILYAPTWREDQHKAGVGYVYNLGVDFKKLQTELKDEYVILFRTHYFIANKFDFSEYESFIIDASAYEDINELYIISDMLITDYSSVFFDFANLKRPIIFYMYDLDEYKNELRDFYIDLNELPGEVIINEEDLILQIKKVINTNFYNKKYIDFNNKYNYLDDNYSSKRVVEACIEN